MKMRSLPLGQKSRVQSCTSWNQKRQNTCGRTSSAQPTSLHSGGCGGRAFLTNNPKSTAPDYLGSKRQYGEKRSRTEDTFFSLAGKGRAVIFPPVLRFHTPNIF